MVLIYMILKLDILIVLMEFLYLYISVIIESLLYKKKNLNFCLFHDDFFFLFYGLISHCHWLHHLISKPFTKINNRILIIIGDIGW